MSPRYIGIIKGALLLRTRPSVSGRGKVVGGGQNTGPGRDGQHEPCLLFGRVRS